MFMTLQSISAGFLALFLLAMAGCQSAQSDSTPVEASTQASSLARWENRKFSMFIHWGIYSIPAGIWKGKQISGYSEQIQGHAKISSAEYRKLAQDFNPVAWNPDSVVLLAKAAGMKSIVITSKHHDGFCMFASDYTDFDVVDATPYGRDVIKGLSEACRRHGLKLGLYYSLIDWAYEGALPFASVRNSDSIPPAHHAYNLHQVEELLSNYGDISELWFDMGAPTAQQSKEVVSLVKKLQPNCLVSGRIWHGQGDFAVMGDNYTPTFKMGVPWQTPASMFRETWSYRSWQERGDVEVKVKEKINDLLNIVSNGGNYLLNIGPKADGSVEAFEKEVLLGMGKWMKQNGEGIYGTRSAELPEQNSAYISATKGKLFLYLTAYPPDGLLRVKGLNTVMDKIYPLNNKAMNLKSTIENDHLLITLNKEVISNPYASLIVLEHKHDLSIVAADGVAAEADGSYVLSADNGETYHSYYGADYYSTKATVVKLVWQMAKAQKEKGQMVFNYQPEADNEQFSLVLNGREYTIDTGKNKGRTVNKTIEGVQLNQQHINTLVLKAKNPVNINKGFNAGSLSIRVQ